MFLSRTYFTIFKYVSDNIFDNFYDYIFVVYPLCKESL